MAAPIILYHNLMDEPGATLTASSTATGYDVNHVKDRLSFTYWKSVTYTNEWIKIDLGATSSVYANAIAITGHNLYTTNADYAVQYSTDDVTYSPAVVNPYPQEGHIFSDAPTLVTSVDWSAGSGSRYWKIRFDFGDSAIQIGSICLGRKLELPERMDQGFDPDALQLALMQSRSRGGTFVGNVAGHVKQRVKLKFGPAGLSRSSFHDATGTPSVQDFLRNYWAKGKPFWFKWGGEPTADTHYRHGYYCHPPADAKSTMPMITSTRRGWGFEFDVHAEGF